MVRNVENLLTFSGGLCNFEWIWTHVLDRGGEGVPSAVDALRSGGQWRVIRKPYKTLEEEMIGCKTLTIRFIRKFLVCKLSGKTARKWYYLETI
jgi:hypothetical protein